YYTTMSHLDNHSKKNSFRVPETYFDTLDDKLSDSAYLESIKEKSSGFKVSESYFDDFEHSVIAKVKTLYKPTKVVALNRTEAIQYIAAVAAVVLVVFSIFNFSNVDSTPNLETIDNALISQYVEQGFVEFSDAELEQYFSMDELNIS